MKQNKQKKDVCSFVCLSGTAAERRAKRRARGSKQETKQDRRTEKQGETNFENKQIKIKK